MGKERVNKYNINHLKNIFLLMSEIVAMVDFILTNQIEIGVKNE